MYKIGIAMVATAVLIVTGVAAQEQDACDAVLSVAKSRNSLRVRDVIERDNYKNYCETQLDERDTTRSKNAAVKIFGQGSGKAGGNHTERVKHIREWCDTNKQYAFTDSALSREEEEINNRAIEAWEDCKRRAGDGFLIEVRAEGKYQPIVEILLKYGKDTGIPIHRMSTVNYTCEATATGKGGKTILIPDAARIGTRNEPIAVARKRPVTFTCTRKKAVEQNRAGEQRQVLEEGLISIALGDGAPFQLPIPEIDVTPLSKSKADILTAELIAAKAELQALEGAVVSFARECPSGWSEYEPAYGRFVRGVDRSKKDIDSDGERNIGNTQEDTLKEHAHEYKDIYAAEYHGDVDIFKDGLNNNGGDKGFDEDNNGFEWQRTTEQTGSVETRPKNVALLFCRKD